MADCTQASLNAEVREGEQLYVQPPEGRSPKILTDGRRVVWKERKAMLGLGTSPRRWQEHLSGKLKERGFDQDERDPCLFVGVGHLHWRACGRYVGSVTTRGHEETAGGAIEGHDNAMGYGD